MPPKLSGWILAAAATALASATVVYATGYLSITGMTPYQRYVNVTIHNPSAHKIGATLTVEVTKEGILYTGAKQIEVRPGGTIIEPVSPDGITDDIDPLDVIEGEVTNEIVLN
jgi:hypothetical protein